MSDIDREIKQTFNLQMLRKAAAKNLDARGWAAYQAITQEHQAQRRFAERTFELEFDERVAQARRRLIDKAGSKGRDLVPRWFGQDRFDRAAIEQQARQEVRHAHLNDIARIDAEESKYITQLLESAAQRARPARDFSQAADRRAGNDRRIRKRSIG